MYEVVNSEFGIRNSEFRPVAPTSRRTSAGKSEIRNPKSAICVLLLSVILFSACAHRGPATPTIKPIAPTPAPVVTSVEQGSTERGIASWYGEPYHGRRTASGEVYDMHQLTAAHKTLPFDTLVRVTRRDTGADVEVRINDRGPFIEGRIIDLSYAAAKKIHLDVDGVAPVKIKVIGRRRAAPAPENATGSARDASATCFWVQVGAFSGRGNAVRAERDLERTGEDAVMLEGVDGIWRVRLGPFDNEQAAERTRNRVTEAWPGAHVLACGG